MSNRPNYRKRRDLRHLATSVLPVVRAVHDCTCQAIETRHHDDGSVTFLHDDGCPLIERSQLVIRPSQGHEGRKS